MLARFLGVEQFGVYVYAITWINILAIICLLGLQMSLVRFIAEYNIKQSWGLLRGILRKSNELVLASSFVVSLAGIFIVNAFKDQISHEMTVTFFVAFFVLPVMSFCLLREATLRALKYVVQSEVLQRVIWVLLLILGVIILRAWVGGGLLARHVMACHLGAMALTFVIGTALLRKFLPAEVSKNKPTYANKQWLKVSLPLLAISGTAIVLNRTDIVMLGFYRGADQAGIYSAATKVADLLVLALTAVNSILAPMIAELFHTGQKEKLQRIIKFSARIVFLFTMLIAAVLIVFGKFMLSIFGVEFIASYEPMLILLVGQIVNSLCGCVGLVMVMSNFQNQASVIFAISAILNIILNIILIPILGLKGAALSTVITMILWNVSMLIFVRIKLGINTTILPMPSFGGSSDKL
jgi:O-antigen/teichoic acid export membrane protein